MLLQAKRYAFERPSTSSTVVARLRTCVLSVHFASSVCVCSCISVPKYRMWTIWRRCSTSVCQVRGPGRRGRGLGKGACGPAMARRGAAAKHAAAQPDRGCARQPRSVPGRRAAGAPAGHWGAQPGAAVFVPKLRVEEGRGLRLSCALSGRCTAAWQALICHGTGAAESWVCSYLLNGTAMCMSKDGWGQHLCDIESRACTQPQRSYRANAIKNLNLIVAQSAQSCAALLHLPVNPANEERACMETQICKSAAGA